MHELHIVINNKIATYMRRDGFVVCNNNDYMVVFAFDAEWDDYTTKTARFIWNGRYTDVPFTGNTVALPMVKNTTLVTVGVYAGDLRTTTPARIECKRSILCGRAFENPNPYEPPEIPEGYIIPEGEKTITENGSHDVREFATAVVAVPASKEEMKLQERAVFVGGFPETYRVEPDENHDGLSAVEIYVEPELQEKEITENGEYTPPDGVLGFSKVTVNVETAAEEVDTVELDFTDYENGSFTETLSDGRVVTHTVIFDGDVPIWVDNIDVNGV